MGYLHINNLYRCQDILLFRECWALEKVHGTSAHISWHGDDARLLFFSGGEPHARFVELFDQEELGARFRMLGLPNIVVYGEAYGGKQQGMRATYGDDLRFIVFDVRVGNSWLSVPDMEQVATGLTLEVVPFRRLPTDITVLDAERDRSSEVAERRGLVGAREGIVLRPLIEVIKNNGERIIAKHKAEKFAERATPQKLVDRNKLKVLDEASAIAKEWVTPMRLTHVLQRFPGASIEHTREIIAAMVEDIYREGRGELVESREAAAAIGRRTAALFKTHLKCGVAWQNKTGGG
mgnify:FL=1